jgi:hypothetical protein
MLIRGKDKSCLCCLWVWWSWCDCHPTTVAWKQWSSKLQERSVYVQVRDWFCLPCMDYGLLEAVIYYYYYYFKLSYFWPKIWEIFFFTYVYIWLFFWGEFCQIFYQKIGKKKTPKSWSLWNKYFQNLVVYHFSKKAATMLPNMYDHLGSSFTVYLCEECFLISC